MLKLHFPGENVTQDLLAVAKQGDAHAIARLINRSLQPKGITAKTSFRDGCLKVMLESESIPDQSALALYVYKGLASLDIESIATLIVYGRQTGDEFPSWTQEFSFSPFGPLEPQMTAQPQIVSPAQPQFIAPVPVQPTTPDVCCPKCKSTQVLVGQKKFSVSNAAVGFVLLGPLGLLGGAIGRDRVSLSCVRCGHVWEPHKTQPAHHHSSPGNLQGGLSLKTIPARKCTPAKLQPPTMGDRVIYTVLSFMGTIVMTILFVNIPLISILCLVSGILLGVWFVMGDGKAMTIWKGNCPYCDGAVSASHRKTSITCVHCKGEITIKNQRFYSSGR